MNNKYKKKYQKIIYILIGFIGFYLNNKKKHIYLSKTLTLLNKHDCQAKT
jgi:hypothetical protein